MSGEPSLLRRIDQSGIPLLIIRIVLGAMFIYTGATKAAHPFDFMKMIRQYHMIPDGAWWALNISAITVPWIEIFCGVLLIAGIALRGTALLMVVMLVVFTGAVLARAIGIYQTQDIAFCAIKFDCGCGTGEEYTCVKVPKNLGLLLLSFIVLFSRSRRFCLWRNLVPSKPLPCSMQGH